MGTGDHFKSKHRGVEPRQAEKGNRALKIVHLSVRKTAAPVVEYGSGWYHDDAISHAHDVASHRSM